MIPITEDELTDVLWLEMPSAGSLEEEQEQTAEARRLARLMLASEQMYEALTTTLNMTDSRNQRDKANKLLVSALAAAEGRK